MISARAVNRLLRSLGYEIHRVRLVDEDRGTMRAALQQAKQAGLNPATVLDIGAAEGTLPLYDVFPDARHLLVEPLREYRPYLDRLAQERPRLEYVLAAAAGRPGEITINVHFDLCSSSILQHADPTLDGTARVVPTVTLDGLAGEKKLEPPYLIKIDAEGAELDILAGARALLAETLYVVLEVSLFEVHQGGPQLFEVVSYMKERGFVAYDVFDPAYRPRDAAMSRLDMAFVQESGPLRAHLTEATPEQTQQMLRQQKIVKSLRWG